jgi:hypothetical protein
MNEFDNVDYDDGQRLWVAGIVAQVQALYPANGIQWGETHPLVGPRASATQVEFKDGARAMLALLGRQGSGRLHVLVVNFHAARQAVVEQAAREKALAAKALEEEKARAEKPTPTFAEHELIAERIYDGYATHTLSMREYVLIHIIYSLHLYNESIHTHT